jgi:hypothetical protein
MLINIWEGKSYRSSCAIFLALISTYCLYVCLLSLYCLSVCSYSYQIEYPAEEHQLIEREILSFVMKKSSRTHRATVFWIPFSTVHNTEKDRRQTPGPNPRAIEQVRSPQHFKMETLNSTCNMINHGDYLTNIYLADALLHVLVVQCSHRYFQFSWEGQLYQFRVFPFGLPLSLLVFTKILKPVLKWARRKGTLVGLLRRFTNRRKGPHIF